MAWPGHGQCEGVSTLRINFGKQEKARGKGAFWHRKEEGSSYCYLYYVRNKRLQLRQEPC